MDPSASFARYSVPLLRVSLGAVFLAFGALKFVPGLSPAEGLVQATMRLLTFGFLSDGGRLLLAAVVETLIGLSLVTGRCLRAGLALLAVAMVGIMSPVALFARELFTGPGAPTLEAQYVLKDVVLAAAGLVVAATTLGAWLTGTDGRQGPRAIVANSTGSGQRLGRSTTPATPRAAAALLAVALVACSAPDPAAAPPVTAAGDTTVVLEDNAFTPVNLAVPAGTTVTWDWQDGDTDHNVVADDFSSDVQSSGTFAQTFTNAGTYEYRCTLHSQMTAQVQVQ